MAGITKLAYDVLASLGSRVLHPGLVACIEAAAARRSGAIGLVGKSVVLHVARKARLRAVVVGCLVLAAVLWLWWKLRYGYVWVVVKVLLYILGRVL